MTVRQWSANQVAVPVEQACKLRGETKATVIHSDDPTKRFLTLQLLHELDQRLDRGFEQRTSDAESFRALSPCRGPLASVLG